MPTNVHLANFHIKVGGAEVAPEFMADLREVVVDSTLAAPDMVVVRVWVDPIKLTWIDEATFDLEKEIEVSVDQTVLFKGEITSLEPTIDSSGGCSYLIRGYDKSNRLRLGTKTRTFVKQKDSDLASTIAGEAGLSITADSTTIVYDWLLQYNQTNMEFLAERARKIGYQVATDGPKLFFQDASAQPGKATAIDLTYAQELSVFRPRISAARQPKKAAVKGWDPAAKQAITSEAASVEAWNTPGYGQQGPDKTFVASAVAAVVDDPVVSAAEATARAQSVLNDANTEFVEAEGVCLGMPKIKAGAVVNIKNVGTRFGGKYYVTDCTHLFTPEDGYTTTFRCSGRQPASVTDLLAPGAAASGGGRSGKIYGVVVGIVTNLKDPLEWGRIKVKYPWLDDTIESDWVRWAAPAAGATRGFMFLPEINDEVLIAFEHGDPARPFALGALWNGKDKPPLANSAVVGSSGTMDKRIIQTRVGHKITLDDTQNAAKISVETPAGHKFILDDTKGGEQISIVDKTGSNKIVIDSVKNSIAINTAGNFDLTATGNVTISATGKLAITTKATAAIEATGSLSVKGTGPLTLESMAKTDLKGPMVSVTASGITQIQGSLVKIN